MPPETSLDSVQHSLNRVGYKIVPGYTVINSAALPQLQSILPTEWVAIENPLPRLVSYAWRRNRFGVNFGYFCCQQESPEPFLLRGLSYTEAYVQPQFKWRTVDNLELMPLADQHNLIWCWQIEKNPKAYYILTFQEVNDLYVDFNFGEVDALPYLLFEEDGHLNPHQQPLNRFPTQTRGLLNMLFSSARDNYL
jgi:hypothetical protein